MHEPYVFFVSLAGTEVTRFVTRREHLFAVEGRAPKVAHDNVVIIRDQDIAGVHVAVDDALGVYVGEAFSDLDRPPVSWGVGVGVVAVGLEATQHLAETPSRVVFQDYRRVLLLPHAEISDSSGVRPEELEDLAFLLGIVGDVFVGPLQDTVW
jgi:hypothetical protein